MSDNLFPSHLQIHVPASADPAAIVSAPHVRITVLSSRLLRLEYSPDDHFEDRPSQPFWYRRQPVPEFSVQEDGDKITVTTGHLTLTYTGGGFTPDSLQISGDSFQWHYGQTSANNLLGTYRTLDGISGNTPLEPGLLSRDGWTLVDDSHTLVFNQQGWLEPRSTRPETYDLYFFGYGQDYQSALQDYARITGPAPMFPRYVLGNWWSRYWAYTQDELRDLMLEFKEHQVPLSVCIIDMDWHITNTPYHTGWTGYTWNRDLFPDPAGFIQWLHDMGLRTAMNLHPADGIAPHEAQYPALAKRLGMDPSQKEPIAFDIASPEFTVAYLEELHHPHEADGVDFWWMDWQQGEVSGLPGLDPLWLLNHIHYYDLGRDGVKRPFIFSRWGGLGSHRYPIGFSGDTFVDWPSLAFQPYFTATAANVRYGWWSHDIGGHNLGTEEPELYARWVQFGVFSPIFRLHSTKNPFHERCPWGYDAETERVSIAAMRLRQALIPYLYSMMWRDHNQSLALVRPMYHLFPEREEAYVCPGQYAFGSELIAAPYTQPADAHVGMSRQAVWLPQGDWYDFTSGQFYPGDRWHTIYGDLKHVPVFAKAGGILPLAAGQSWSETGNPEVLELRLYAGADNQFDLYEDDGETQKYQDGAYAITRIEQRWKENALEIVVHAPDGAYGFLPAQRHWKLSLYGVANPSQISAWIDDQEIKISARYDDARECLQLGKVECPIGSSLRVILRTSGVTLLSHRDRTEETIWSLLRAFRQETYVKHMLTLNMDALLNEPEAVLLRYNHSLSESQKRALMEIITASGAFHIDYLQDEDIVVMWNQRPEFAPEYHYTSRAPGYIDQERYGAGTGTLKGFKALHFPRKVSVRGWSEVEREMHWWFELHYGQAASIEFRSNSI